MSMNDASETILLRERTTSKSNDPHNNVYIKEKVQFQSGIFAPGSDDARMDEI